MTPVENLSAVLASYDVIASPSRNDAPARTPTSTSSSLSGESGGGFETGGPVVCSYDATRTFVVV